MEIPRAVRATTGPGTGDRGGVERLSADEIPFTAGQEPPHRHLTRTELRGMSSDLLRGVAHAAVGVNHYLVAACNEVLAARGEAIVVWPEGLKSGTRLGVAEEENGAVIEMRADQLPTWHEIVGKALESLNAARADLSEVSNWLRSDWRPLGSPLTDEAADARSAVFNLVGEMKGLVDEAKDHLEKGRRR